MDTMQNGLYMLLQYVQIGTIFCTLAMSVLGAITLVFLIRFLMQATKAAKLYVQKNTKPMEEIAVEAVLKQATQEVETDAKTDEDQEKIEG